MIPEVQCPDGGPVVMIEPLTGEKYANCSACHRCGGCARGAFVPELDFNIEEFNRDGAGYIQIYCIGYPTPATIEGEKQKALKTAGRGLRPIGVRK